MKEEALKKSEIEKFLKYAEFMRGRNRGRLEEYYKIRNQQ